MKRGENGKVDPPISRRRLLKIGALTTVSLLIPGAALADEWVRLPSKPEHSTSFIRRARYTLRRHSLPPPSQLQSLPAEDARSLSMYNPHTGESLNTVYWEYGDYAPGALDEVNYFFRDFHVNEVKQIDPHLLDILYTLYRYVEARAPITLLSGYRSPATNAWLASFTEGVALRSMHIQGQAADIYIPGRRLSYLERVALALRGGGVGYYPRNNFVHIDTGRVRRW